MVKSQFWLVLNNAHMAFYTPNGLPIAGSGLDPEDQEGSDVRVILA